MIKTLIPTIAALGLATAAQAQTTTPTPETNLMTTTVGNGNVTKIDGTVAGIDVRGISNPGQTRVQLRDTPVGNIQVRLKNDDFSKPGDLTDINLNPTTNGNGNVTKVDGNIGNLDVRGISTPGTTNLTVRPPQ